MIMDQFTCSTVTVFPFAEHSKIVKDKFAMSFKQRIEQKPDQLCYTGSRLLIPILLVFCYSYRHLQFSYPYGVMTSTPCSTYGAKSEQPEIEEDTEKVCCVVNRAWTKSVMWRDEHRAARGIT